MQTTISTWIHNGYIREAKRGDEPQEETERDRQGEKTERVH